MPVEFGLTPVCRWGRLKNEFFLPAAGRKNLLPTRRSCIFSTTPFQSINLLPYLIEYLTLHSISIFSPTIPPSTLALSLLSLLLYLSYISILLFHIFFARLPTHTAPSAALIESSIIYVTSDPILAIYRVICINVIIIINKYFFYYCHLFYTWLR